MTNRVCWLRALDRVSVRIRISVRINDRVG